MSDGGLLFKAVCQCQRPAGRSRQASLSSVPGNESADSGGIMETAGVELKSPRRKQVGVFVLLVLHKSI